MSLYRGVTALSHSFSHDKKETLDRAIGKLKSLGKVKTGDLICFVEAGRMTIWPGNDDKRSTTYPPSIVLAPPNAIILRPATAYKPASPAYLTYCLLKKIVNWRCGIGARWVYYWGSLWYGCARRMYWGCGRPALLWYGCAMGAVWVRDGCAMARAVAYGCAMGAPVL
eukprot:8753537-Pyramimonas_sp.AAC.2